MGRFLVDSFSRHICGFVARPAPSLRTEAAIVKRLGTAAVALPPSLVHEASSLLNGIDISTVVGLRDRALIVLMTYSFARVSAAMAMDVEDYLPTGKRWWIRLQEKGGKRHELPAHHNLEAYLDAYIEAVGIRDDKKGSPLPLSQQAHWHSHQQPHDRVDA